MKKQLITPVSVAAAALVLLVALFLVRVSLHRPARVVLPQTAPLSDESGALSGDGERLRRVEVTPATVQRAIAVLSRPESYSRGITIERYYEGGSGKTNANVSVSSGWMRLDAILPSGAVRHVISGDGGVWIWYGDEGSVFASASPFSADEEQNIPTYEDVLSFPSERIAQADYRQLDGVECIYVETADAGDGYVERWWVSVRDGLLAASEKSFNGQVVYRMSGMEVTYGGESAERFTLPDGTVLHTPDEAL